MNQFYSIDWGTTSLRVRLISVQNDSINILSESSDHRGVGWLYNLWENEKSTLSREAYFLTFLQSCLVKFAQYLPANAAALPVVISGMASSSIGIREIPYSPIPFHLNGNDLIYEVLSRPAGFAHDVLLLSGLCSSSDVMRGEEVQLLGLSKYHGVFPKALYLFPGTHSKHILVENHQATSFKTYITGEMFKLLSEYSVLKNSIQKADKIDENSFHFGLKLRKDNILHSAFTIRALSVLNKNKNICNYSLLSGLLIGLELNYLEDSDIPIYICAHKNLSPNYELAIRLLSLDKRSVIVPSEIVDEAVVYGQMLLFKKVFG